MTEFAGTPELAGVRRGLLREPLFIFDNSWMSSNTVCCAPTPMAVLCVDTSLRPLPDFESPLSAVAQLRPCILGGWLPWGPGVQAPVLLPRLLLLSCCRVCGLHPPA